MKDVASLTLFWYPMIKTLKSDQHLASANVILTQLPREIVLGVMYMPFVLIYFEQAISSDHA